MTTGKNQNDVKKNEKLPERGQWSGKFDFIFGCISYAVGLGNVWRFPYLCYENGGGAFLIPFVICIVFCGIPLFVLEVSIGQYLKTGGIGIWNLVPILKGIGFASMTMIGLCNIYYIVLVAWTFFYFFSSFQSDLPWKSCDHWWNTEKCIAAGQLTTPLNETSSSVKEFWERRVLSITDGIEDVGEMRWELIACLLVAWLLAYVVIWRGLHQSGKIIWFTALFPYVILVILFFRGVTLDGAGQGILYYLTPRWEKLAEAKVWISAATQVLFSYGIGIGANVALGSYNRFNHNFYRDSITACIISSSTSFFAGLVIFSILGHMAHVESKSVADVAQSGPGLAFLAYPAVVIRLPWSPLWAILFFLMLIIIGTDSQFCTIEAFITGIVDEWPELLRPRRKMFTLSVIVIKFLLGIPLMTGGGMYLFQLMDFFSASSFSLLTVVLIEVIGLCWIYGTPSLTANIELMLGRKPGFIFQFCWRFMAPLVITMILIFSIINYERISYANKYLYPWWGELLGWLMAASSIIWIPLYMIYFLLNENGSLKERFVKGLQPRIDEKPKQASIPGFNIESGF